MELDLDQAALQAQLESLASRWSRDADDQRRGVATISDAASYSAGYADALDRASQSLKGLLDQWQ